MKKQCIALLTAIVLCFLFCLPALAASDTEEWDESILLIGEDEDSLTIVAYEGDDALQIVDGTEDTAATDDPADAPLLISTNGHPPRLVDESDLLTSTQELDLTAKLNEVSERQQFDVAIVTVNSLDGKSEQDYADDYFDYNGYGLGSDRSGALLLICMKERVVAISGRGYAETALTDYGIERILDDVVPSVADMDYETAAEAFISDCDSYVTRARNGDPVDVDEEDIEGGYKAPFPVAKSLVISAIVGVVVAIVVGSSLKSKMISVRAANTAADYTRPGSFVLREQNEVFLYNNVTRTAIPQQTRSGGGSHGGSTTHTSSSGASHVGGSRHF